ncbi:MAG TPA: hypothetical protein PLG90_01430 [Ignavibacteria bacterium]|nr:hypothetical protein [Ignavibacteria bacterium]
MENINVDNLSPCKPISELLELLLTSGFILKEKKLSDYHFNEFYYSLTANSPLDRFKKNEILKIENLKKLSENEFYCTCHWSIVKIT